MDKIELKLVWLYPDILNLHGERGSVQAFQKVAENLGISLEIERIDNYTDKIDFENTDIIFCPPGELKVIPEVKKSLEIQKEELEQYIKDRKYLIAVGTTGSLLAKETIREDNTKIEGLGILDITGQERKMVLGDDLHFLIEKTKQEIIGSQIQMIDFTLHKAQPLGETIYGYGNSGAGNEGARNLNVIFTNCLGPVFVKNPWWTEAILKDAVLNKISLFSKEEYTIENKSFETTKDFIKRKPKIT